MNASPAADDPLSPVNSLGDAIPPSTDAASPATIRSIPSVELFQGDREVWIVHGEKTYRLQITRNDRLILVK